MVLKLERPVGLTFVICALALFSLLQGCVTTPVAPPQQPQQALVSTDVYDAVLAPAYLYFGQVPAGFNLTLKNKSASAIEIDWNRTAFVNNGKNGGGFMFEGIPFEKRNSPRKPEVVSPGAVLKKDIFPSATADFQNGRWGYAGIEGKVGVLLVIRVEGSESQQAIILPEPVI